MDSQQQLEPLTFLQKVVENNSVAALVLFALAAVIWLIGGNILVARHYRRLGKSMWSGLKPFAFPFKDFSAREWMGLLVLLVFCLVLFGLGLAVNER